MTGIAAARGPARQWENLLPAKGMHPPKTKTARKTDRLPEEFPGGVGVPARPTIASSLPLPESAEIHGKIRRRSPFNRRILHPSACRDRLCSFRNRGTERVGPEAGVNRFPLRDHPLKRFETKETPGSEG
jgi:hypothetical protein